MSEENNPQVIILKSNWAKQLIIAVVVLVFFFFAIGKNPSKSDFIQGCVKEYLKKEQSFGSSTSNYVSEISTGIFGSWFEPLVEREDYLVFSKFNVEIDNDKFKMKIKAFGFWGNIYFSEGIMERKEPVQSEMELDEGENNGCPGFEKFKQEVELAYGGAENVDVNKFGTFDHNNCKGSYDGASYFWDGDSWKSLE